MKYLAKCGVLFLAGILFSVVFSTSCPAAKYEEKGLQVIPIVSAGKIAGARIILGAANGGPKINVLQLNYPGSTVLTTTASLTTKKGLYKIELLEKDTPSLTLTAQDGKTVKGSGRMIVSASGSVQYRVTAKKAKYVVLNLLFSPVPDVSRVNRTSAAERASTGGDGLSLKLSCIAGNNCLLQVQNLSQSKAYRNILFRIDYRMMTRNGTIEKSKSGGIDDALLPEKTGQWPLDIVFGEPPKDIKVSLIKADAVDPAGITAPATDQRSVVVPLFETRMESDVTSIPAVPVPVAAEPSAPAPDSESEPKSEPPDGQTSSDDSQKK